MRSLQNQHPLWWISIEISLYLVLFIVVTAIIVFLLRGPMRKYKAKDILVFKNLEKFYSVNNNRFMNLLTFLGKHYFLIPANLILIAAFIIFGQHYWYAFRLFVMSISSLLLMFILKYLFHRRRPADPLLEPAKGKSFPSGHAIMSVNFYGLLLYMILQSGNAGLVNAVAYIFFILLVFAIGFSRVYLRVHYASDVLAGFIVGCCWLYTSLHIFNKLQVIMPIGN